MRETDRLGISSVRPPLRLDPRAVTAGPAAVFCSCPRADVARGVGITGDDCTASLARERAFPALEVPARSAGGTVLAGVGRRDCDHQTTGPGSLVVQLPPNLARRDVKHSLVEAGLLPDVASEILTRPTDGGGHRPNAQSFYADEAVVLNLIRGGRGGWRPFGGWRDGGQMRASGRVPSYASSSACHIG